MDNLMLSQLQHPLNARLIGADAPFIGITSDSRAVRPNQLFVALVGERFDGHDFVAAAAEQGAAGALVCRELATDLPQLLVDDTLRGLGALAAWHRRHQPGRVVGITGSNGKTTVKELIAAILGRSAPTLATRGNLNNEIGMPLTLLELRDEAYAVIEMGANHAGEIGRLSRIAQPDVALLNNAGRAHLEGFGSVEGVARAKGEIVEGLSADGVFIFNADDVWGDYWRGLAGPWRRVGFGMGAGEVRGESLAEGRLAIHCADWRIEVRPRLDGEHNRMNMVAAAAAAWALGIPEATIRAGLEAVVPVKGRLQPIAGINGSQLIDDSYNGNPDSVAAAIRYLAAQPGRRFLALGELAELGDGVDAIYEELGEQAHAAGLDGLWAVMPAEIAARSFGAGGRAFATLDELLTAAREIIGEGDRVLVKGSRRAGMERVVAGLSCQQAGGAN